MTSWLKSAWQKTVSSVSAAVVSAGTKVAGVVAPDNHDYARELQYSYDLMMECLENMSDREEIECSKEASKHVKALVEALMKEDQEEREEPGPCLEFVLHKGVVRTLCEHGNANNPKGFRGPAFRAVGSIIGVRQQILPHGKVVGPVAEVLRQAARMAASGTPRKKPDTPALAVAVAVALKIGEDPAVMTLPFLEDNPPSCPLLQVITPFLRAADESGDSGRAALLALLQVPNHDFQLFLAQHTSLTARIIDAVVEAYQAQPTVLDKRWTEQEPSPLAPFSIMIHFAGMAATAMLEASLAEDVGSELLNQFLSLFTLQFLQGVIQPALLETSEPEIKAATVYLTNAVRACGGTPLEQTISQFLLGEEEDDSELRCDPKEPLLRRVLINRMEDNSDEISVVTLQLFDALLERHAEHTMWNLVLRNLAPEYHLQPSNSVLESPGVTPGRKITSPDDLRAVFPAPPGASMDVGIERYAADAYCAVAHASASFDIWSEKMRSPMRLSAPNTPAKREDLTAEQGDELATVADEGIAPSTAAGADNVGDSGMVTPRRRSAEPRPEFYEGHFLEVLLRRTERFLEQPLSINLVLTGVLSKLAASPHPLLHDFMLDVNVPLVPGVKALPAILQQVSQTALKEAARIKNFPTLVENTRRSLGVDEHQYGPQFVPDTDAAADSDGSLHSTRIVQAFIVLDEFRKELTAMLENKLRTSGVGDMGF